MACLHVSYIVFQNSSFQYEAGWVVEQGDEQKRRISVYDLKWECEYSEDAFFLPEMPLIINDLCCSHHKVLSTS